MWLNLKIAGGNGGGSGNHGLVGVGGWLVGTPENRASRLAIACEARRTKQLSLWRNANNTNTTTITRRTSGVT